MKTNTKKTFVILAALAVVCGIAGAVVFYANCITGLDTAIMHFKPGLLTGLTVGLFITSILLSLLSSISLYRRASVKSSPKQSVFQTVTAALTGLAFAVNGIHSVYSMANYAFNFESGLAFIERFKNIFRYMFYKTNLLETATALCQSSQLYILS